MKLELSKKTKNYIDIALSVIPIYGITKYYLAVKKIRDNFASDRYELERIENALGTLPKSSEDYETFLKTGDADLVSTFNEALANIKAQDNLSSGFLASNGFADEQSFWTHLDSLYADGKAGDLQAQEQFNTLMSGYQNDIYVQAGSLASENYFAMFSDVNIPSFNPSFIETMTAVDLGVFAVGVVSVGMLYLIVDALLGRTVLAEKRYNKSVIAQQKKEKKALLKANKKHLRAISKMEKMTTQNYRTSSIDYEEEMSYDAEKSQRLYSKKQEKIERKNVDKNNKTKDSNSIYKDFEEDKVLL